MQEILGFTKNTSQAIGNNNNIGNTKEMVDRSGIANLAVLAQPDDGLAALKPELDENLAPGKPRDTELRVKNNKGAADTRIPDTGKATCYNLGTTVTLENIQGDFKITQAGSH